MIGWLSRVLSRIPPAALGPVGPHPNEGLRDVADLSTVLEAPFDFVTPRGMRGAIQRYGDPADAKTAGPSKQWERARMVVARDLPGEWNNQPSGRCKLYVHREAERPLREALSRLERADLLHEVRTLGCYNFRRIRHGKTGPLSYHAFGVAVDVNSADNFGVVEHKVFLGPRNRPVPEPFTDAWYQVWPNGLSRSLVKAFEATGWEWGGRWSGYVDPMHLQLVRTK